MNTHFSLISREYLATIDVTLEAYQHERTGAMHYHFSSQNTENVFMVALRTMPNNSTGVAHILEHTALCGSKNFPVRDPFFSMLRRSMQTFMNAFTSSDWTAYPFATENKQDFDNLLRVYLDAVFFPNLEKLDFMQEGHRFDFDENDNLVLKGVVFNEMKGVYGDVHERLYEMIKSLLHPETTYHYDSGGAPQIIPKLTYEEFVNFHKKHYHPTNATFFTFGDIPAENHHARFEECVLQYFSEKGERIEITDETRFLAPVAMTTEYPSTDTENPFQTHILFAWLGDLASDAKKLLEANLVYSYLLGHSGSPLRHALETYEHTKKLSLSFLDDSGRELRFITGIVTDSAEYADDVEKLIFSTLEKVIADGVPTDEALGIIDQIETSIRAMDSGYPYGLSLFLQAIGATVHGGVAADLLDPSALLDDLREKVKNPHFLAGLIAEQLQKNPHRVRLVAIPSESAALREQEIEKNFCEKTLQKMSEQEKNTIRENAKKLEEHQKMPQNLDLLPKISVSDIPRHIKKSPSASALWNEIFYSVPTNRLWYTQWYIPISSLNEEEIAIFDCIASLYGELGFDGMDYIEAKKMISAKMNFWVSFSLFQRFGKNEIYAMIKANSRFLERNSLDANRIFEKIFQLPRFDEIQHIRHLISEYLLNLKSSLVSSGNATAMRRANSGRTFLANVVEKRENLAQLEILAKFLQKSDEEIVQWFESIAEKIKKEKPVKITISSEKTPENFTENPQHILCESFPVLEFDNFQKYRVNEAWLTDLAVGYCAYSLPAVPADHVDAPLFVLLAQFLRDGFLHSAIREQGGAYGAGASYNSTAESFNFSSYRDPRISGTFEDFEKSILWLLENEHSEERLSEAKIGVIARMDTPTTLANMAKMDAASMLYEISKNEKNAERKKILDATIDDLKRIAREYLTDFSVASRVVVTGKQNREICEKMWFDIRTFDENAN